MDRHPAPGRQPLPRLVRAGHHLVTGGAPAGRRPGGTRGAGNIAGKLPVLFLETSAVEAHNGSRSGPLAHTNERPPQTHEGRGNVKGMLQEMGALSRRIPATGGRGSEFHRRRTP